MKEDSLVHIFVLIAMLVVFWIFSSMTTGYRQGDCEKQCPGGQVEINWYESDKCWCPNERGELILKKVYR